jgi:hypothetical protein
VSRALTLDDIVDLRAYEREREQFRDSIIALKRRRRLAVGPLVTLLFENRDTVRFQVQEMARAERLLRDEAVQMELDAYNPLIPEPGTLSATMFIELTTEEDLRRWLPQLVGIERAVSIAVGDAAVAGVPEAAHAGNLTRDDITASVHYLQFSFADSLIEAFATEPLSARIDLPAYTHEAAIRPEMRAELLDDLRP